MSNKESQSWSAVCIIVAVFCWLSKKTLAKLYLLPIEIKHRLHTTYIDSCYFHPFWYFNASFESIVQYFLYFYFTENDDSEEPIWHFAPTRRGATILVINGFQFYRYTNSGSGLTKRWLCNAYRRHGWVQFYPLCTLLTMRWAMFLELLSFYCFDIDARLDAVTMNWPAKSSLKICNIAIQFIGSVSEIINYSNIK